MNNTLNSRPRPNKARVCVIGAGVVGLSTAVRILEESQKWKGVGVEVTVVADRFSPYTTSDGSGGFWEPYNIGGTPDALLRKWGGATWDHMYQLAMSAEHAGTVGAQFISGYQMYDTPQLELPWYKDKMLAFRLLTERELSMFPGARCGYFLTTLEINIQKYLPWLMQRFKNAGGKTEFKTVENLSQVAEQYDLVVNCTGPGAGQLMKDPLTVPIRGQLRRIRAPWIKHFYLLTREKGEPSYILPLGEEVLVGGVAQRGNVKEEVDRRDSEDIWIRALAVFPFIQGGRTIREWAGLRPGRSTVRLEKDQVRTKDGRTVPVVHNYGHGGSGVTLHWGCAAEAAHMVLSSLPPSPPTLHSKM